MKRVLISLLTTCFTLSAFAQSTQEQSTQVVEVQKGSKVSHTYSWQPFVVGGVAIGVPTTSHLHDGAPTSFRLQAGIVKRWGFYVAGTTNFRFAQPEEDEENNFLWEWKGKHFYSRWSFLVGPIVHFTPNFMMYWGLGLGRCYWLREGIDGKIYGPDFIDDWMLLEADLGFMYRIKRLVVSAGFSSGNTLFQWYSTGNIGVGVMF